MGPRLFGDNAERVGARVNDERLRVVRSALGVAAQVEFETNV